VWLNSLSSIHALGGLSELSGIYLVVVQFSPVHRGRRFEFVGGGSSKFWEISYRGPEVIIRFGRIGTNGQTQTKDLGSETEAAFYVAKLIKEKLAKGYVAVAGTQPGRMESPRATRDFGTGITRPPVVPPYEVPALPGDGPFDIEGVRLPVGRRLSGNPSMAPPGVEMIPAPVLWATDAPVTDSGNLLYQLRAPLGRIGLTPVLLASLEGDDSRPWDDHEFGPSDPRRIDHFDVNQVLADMWRQTLDEQDEESLAPLEPFGLDFPGLAAAPVVKAPSGFGRLFSQVSDPNDDRAVLRSLPARRIGLVAANRAADIITALGWNGGVNLHQDPVLMSVVLRSWEDRWAARVVEIGFDILTLTVGIVARDRQTALALAAEHFAFCPDNVWQGTGALIPYGESIQGSRIWAFWWD